MIDQNIIRNAVTSILSAIGEDVNREGLVKTPDRVARMYAELFSGLLEDPVELLKTGFEEAHDDTIVLKDISFYSICEHHLLPFWGKAHVGYVPGALVVGASKLARVVDTLARRPQIQERLTNQLAEVVYSSLCPKGVMVIVSAEHMCMSLRGIKKPGSGIVTTASRGVLKTEPEARREFFELLKAPLS